MALGIALDAKISIALKGNHVLEIAPRLAESFDWCPEILKNKRFHLKISLKY